MSKNKNYFKWILGISSAVLIFYLRVLVSLKVNDNQLKNIQENQTLLSVLFTIGLLAIVFFSILGTYFVSLYMLKNVFDKTTIHTKVKLIIYKVYFTCYSIYNLIYFIYILIFNKLMQPMEQNYFSILLYVAIAIGLYSSIRKLEKKDTDKALLIYTMVIFVVNSILPIFSLLGR